jgi:GMP synthase-like glutamine amidotransferase
MTLRVRYLQHADGEGPGAIEEWAVAHGHRLDGTHLYRGDPLPQPGDFDLLVVLGGGMNVSDEHRVPWLAAEKRFLRAAVQGDAPVLGICLGSQLLADALGAAVHANPEPEIGWFPVARTTETSPAFAGFPRRAVVFHWHEQTWDLPPGAVRLASSAACAGQAFAYRDRVIGLQFHPEMTPAIAGAMLDAEGELPTGRCVQAVPAILADAERFEGGNALLRDILDRLAELAAAGRLPSPTEPNP